VSTSSPSAAVRPLASAYSFSFPRRATTSVNLTSRSTVQPSDASQAQKGSDYACLVSSHLARYARALLAQFHTRPAADDQRNGQATIDLEGSA
jgi:hypothetical protein